ncbi:DUF397 domain-containing protein [Streptomyces sennicomposti]
MSLKLAAGDDAALSWFKSSYSTDDGPACVEVARTPVAVHVRDSKHSQSPQLAFSSQQWSAFIENVGGLT